MNFQMNKTLLFILLASIYSSAITCTEATFAAANAKEYDNVGKIRQDSSYFREHNNGTPNEWTHKFYWTNGQLDSLLFDSKDGTPVKNVPYHIHTNESTLFNKDYEIVYNKAVSGDTTIYTLKKYYNGQFENSETIKYATHYTEALTENSEGSKDFSRIYFSADTLIQERTFDYGTPEARTSYNYFIPDPNDEKKCSEYEGETKDISIKNLLYEISSSDTENGFVIKIQSESYYREFYLIDGAKTDGTSSLKKRSITKLHKDVSENFDALGRHGAALSPKHAVNFAVPMK